MAASTPSQASQHTEFNRPLRLLALDGGGVRGYSELIILHQLMLKIKEHNGSADTPKPCQIFDLIGGTSTGGIIALMLGRLGMSVEQAMAEYENFAKDVFGKPKRFPTEGMYSATTLEEKIKSTVKRFGVLRNDQDEGHPDMKLLENEANTPSCKVFVCTTNSRALDTPRLFRSYLAYNAGEYENMTIWQAARATSAAPTFFKRLKVGPQHAQEEFLDGGLGYNNPTKLLLQETARVFGPERRSVACVISIGTGLSRLAEFQSPSLLQKLAPSRLGRALAQIATDCESTEKDMTRFFSSNPGLYFRFNVVRGLENVSLDEWRDLGNIKAKTINYLHDVDDDMKKAVLALCKMPKTIPASNLSNPTLTRTPRKTSICNVPVQKKLSPPYFIPRKEISKELDTWFHSTDRDTRQVQIIVLRAMGGQGKTQIALDYCYRAQQAHEDGYDFILWANAADSSTVERSFAQFAEHLLAASASSSAAIRSVTAQEESPLEITRRLIAGSRFLLVFDGLDDLSKVPRIKNYLELNGRGDVIITTRNRGCRRIGQLVEVPSLSPDEGQRLLLAQSERSQGMDSHDDTMRIFNALGGLPLGLAQAAHYISETKLSYSEFLKLFLAKMAILEDQHLPDLWEYTANTGGDEFENIKEHRVGIQTAWDLSIDYLLSLEDGNSKLHFLILSAYLDVNGISQAAFDPWLTLVDHATSKNISIQLEIDETAPNSTETRMISQAATWARSLLKEDQRRVAFLKFLSDACRIGLISIEEHGKNGPEYSIHTLVALFLRQRYDKEDYILETAFLISTLTHSLAGSNRNADLRYEAGQHSTSCIKFHFHLRNYQYGLGDLRDAGLNLCFAADIAGNRSPEVYDILSSVIEDETAGTFPIVPHSEPLDLAGKPGYHTESDVLCAMGRIKRTQGNNDEAQHDLERAVHPAIFDRNALAYTQILCLLIEIYVEQGDSVSLTFIYLKLGIVWAQGWPRFTQMSLHTLYSTVNCLQNNPEDLIRALNTLLSCLKLQATGEESDDTGIFQIMTQYYLAISYSISKDYEKAINQFESVICGIPRIAHLFYPEHWFRFLDIASSVLRIVALYLKGETSFDDMQRQFTRCFAEKELSISQRDRILAYIRFTREVEYKDGQIFSLHNILWKFFLEIGRPTGGCPVSNIVALERCLNLSIIDHTLSYELLKDTKVALKETGKLLTENEADRLYFSLTAGYFALGEFEESMSLCKQKLARLAGSGNSNEGIYVRMIGRCCIRLGKHAEFERHKEDNPGEDWDAVALEEQMGGGYQL
ncbi:hypothetical protein F4777DRAFT_547693 [Nemania sp. FL0916]|nr:hypothetical protein F4777DRAFT_547693 [Nemania sp. FL0916]